MSYQNEKGQWWESCWKCDGEGYSHHDCGEDTCCCLHPENNVRCDICNGEGGFYSDEISEA